MKRSAIPFKLQVLSAVLLRNIPASCANGAGRGREGPGTAQRADAGLLEFVTRRLPEFHSHCASILASGLSTGKAHQVRSKFCPPDHFPCRWDGPSVRIPRQHADCRSPLFPGGALGSPTGLPPVSTTLARARSGRLRTAFGRGAPQPVSACLDLAGLSCWAKRMTEDVDEDDGWEPGKAERCLRSADFVVIERERSSVRWSKQYVGALARKTPIVTHHVIARLGLECGLANELAVSGRSDTSGASAVTAGRLS